jgi:hypothetical protein
MVAADGFRLYSASRVKVSGLKPVDEKAKDTG